MSSIHNPGEFTPFAPAPNAMVIDAMVADFERRRVRVVSWVFIVIVSLSLAANFLRPAIYRATAMIEIELPASQPDASLTVLLGRERERITSESVFRAVDRRLGEENVSNVRGTRAPDRELEAEIAADTNLIRLSAYGREPDILALIVNTWVAVYQDKLSQTQDATIERTKATLDTQLAEYEARIREQRSDIDTFREAHAIVSLDSDQNRAPARLKGVSDALTGARQEQTAAEAELESLRQALAEGRLVSASRDERVIADLEARVQDLRAQIRAFDERFTPAYEAYDPSVTAAKKQLADVEAALNAKRDEARQAVISEAAKTLNSARMQVRALDREMTEYQGQATEFMGLYQEHESLQRELSELEQQTQNIRNEIVEAEVANRNLFPRVAVLEPAFTPTMPIRPAYLLDAALGVGASVLLALIAMWVYTRLKNPYRYAAGGVIQQPNIFSYHTQILAPGGGETSLTHNPAGAPALAHQSQRELSLVEVQAMLAACDAGERLLLSLLLTGLTVDEIGQLTEDAFDLEANRIHIGGAQARVLSLPPFIRRALDEAELNRAELFDAAAIPGRLAQVPYTAGLADPGSVDANALRHTYLCFLVRQGLKFDELQRIVGPLDAGAMQQYGEMMPPMPGKNAADVTLVYPALVRSRQVK
ncbi:MAG: hypothetical protein O7B81_00105 [Gammaproteobacteria bacterium]|nr:hypothetical protein [Gammaproteobacteria bacterium]